MNQALRLRFLNFFRRIFQVPLLEKWLVTLTRGKLPNHFFCRFVPNPYQYTKGTFREISVSGIHMKVDVSDYIGHYYFFGFRDPAHENLIALCREDFCILDIGANIGLTALRFAKTASKGKVAAFEPDPLNFSYCMHNLSLNSTGNAAVFNIGLGSSDDLLNLEVVSESNRGGNRISPNPHMPGARVKIKKLDSIFNSLEMEHLDLVKIDVEGYELHVLKGAERTLRKYKPILFIEVDDDHLQAQGYSALELIAFLNELGYDSIVQASDLTALDDRYDFTHCHFDVIVR